MKRIASEIVVLIFLMFCGKLNSQVINPVHWTMKNQKVSANEYVVTIVAQIEPPWHLYSQDNPEQPPATLFSFDLNDSIELVGVVSESESREDFDPNFGMVLKFFEGQANFSQQVKLNTEKRVSLKGTIDYMCCDESKCLTPEVFEFEAIFNENPDAATDNESVSSGSSGAEAKYGYGGSIWGFFLLSFIFGLAAIATPCVFPMIPLTVSYFLKEEKRNGRIKAVFFGLSIILLYVLTGTILAIFLGPEFANFISTHWLPNVLFFIIFLAFALSFFGMFEITLPNWMISKSDKQADKGGVFGAVFMGLTLVLVSFSCTGPIVGMILVESANGIALKPVIGMLGFSVAFALPFTLLAFFPSLLQGLPRSGGWLNSVKVVLGFIELALGLKFLSIADQTYHWGLLDREIYIALWIVIFTLLGFYFLGKIRFTHDSEVKVIGAPRILMAIVTFGFVVYLVPGMIGAPLKALSGYLPPQTSLDFDISRLIRENPGQISTTSNFTGNPSVHSDSNKVKYGDFLKLPHGLKGYFDYKQALNFSKESKKPVFVDFTGHGCVNCREMEANVWSDPSVLNLLKHDFVLAALYVDDKTKIPEEEWRISSYNNRMIKTLGGLNADLQITRFGVNAQPFYVIVDQNGNLLSGPHAYDLNVGNFIDFLENGKKAYHKNSGITGD